MIFTPNSCSPCRASVTGSRNNARNWAAALLSVLFLSLWPGAALKGQAPSKEYIRLGGRLVAIENSGVPPAPTGLTATAGNTQVGLSWTASSGAASYNVYRGPGAGGESTTPIATGITSTSYTNSGLTNGTPYYYKVAAVNAGGTSGYSNEATATPQLSAPPPPTGLTATAGNAQVGLSWSASSGATSYNVYRGTAAGGESTTPIATGITSTSYTNSGLANGTPYYYKVAAVNAGGTSGYSNEATATPQLSAPPPPTGLTATAGNAQVGLNWTASTGATSYNVYRGTAANGESSTPVATGITTTSYTNSGLTNGTPYYYKVAAVNAGGTSGYSNEATATPQVSAPPPPTGLTATAGNAQVGLTWSASSGATSYNVYRGTASGGETLLVSGITTTSYSNTGLTNGTTYYYKVAAVNSGGTSGLSNEAPATPQAPPTASFTISRNGGSFTHSVTASVGDTITYKWSSTNGASYSFYDAIGPSGADGCNNKSGPTSFTPAAGGTAGPYSLISCQSGYTYTMTYTVTAASGAMASDTISIAVLASPPAGLTATAGNAQAGLNWSASSGATSYNVYRGTTPGGETLLVSGITATSYSNTGLTNGTTYYYKVAAVNANGTSGLSNEASATPQGPPPTASFTISWNGSYFTHNVTANVGDTITYQWSSTNGASYSFYDTIGPSGADGCNNKSGPFSFTPAAGGTTGPYSLAACQSGYTYTMTYTVTAASGATASDTITIAVLPPTPTGLVAAGGNGQVTLSWTASTGATSYNIYRSAIPGGEMLVATGVTTLTYTNVGLTNNTTYYYKVAAVNTVGTSALLTEVSAMPQNHGEVQKGG